MLLVPLALFLKLIEPAFRYFVGYSVDHPLGEAAHDVQAVDKKDVGHVLLQRSIEAPLKHEADDNEVSPDALWLLRHLAGVGW